VTHNSFAPNFPCLYSTYIFTILCTYNHILENVIRMAWQVCHAPRQLSAEKSAQSAQNWPERACFRNYQTESSQSKIVNQNWKWCCAFLFQEVIRCVCADNRRSIMYTHSVDQQLSCLRQREKDNKQRCRKKPFLLQRVPGETKLSERRDQSEEPKHPPTHRGGGIYSLRTLVNRR